MFQPEMGCSRGDLGVHNRVEVVKIVVLPLVDAVAQQEQNYRKNAEQTNDGRYPDPLPYFH
jgi:hypothetical protein